MTFKKVLRELLLVVFLNLMHLNKSKKNNLKFYYAQIWEFRFQFNLLYKIRLIKSSSEF